MTLQINHTVARLRCSKSGLEVDSHGFARPLGLCRCCPPPGKPVVVEYDTAKVLAGLSAKPLGQSGSGIWRFAPLLPVVGVPPGFADDVGGTPIAVQAELSAELEVELLLKNEGVCPSGSFKDRGLAVGIALGVASGARRFCLPTQGNAGVAACMFSARLGLRGCLVYMPEGYQGCIYHRACELFGGEVRFAGANIAAAGRKMRADLHAELDRGECVDMSTFFEPGRLEGKKTMGLEIALSLAGRPLPDVIVYPTGGGTGLVGIWKAFGELRVLGIESRRLPRMVTVQAENVAPVVEAFHKGLDEVTPVESRGTVADGLDVPGAIMGHRMLAVLRDSGGTAVAVSEAAIRQAFARYGQLGIPAGYESAATLAGVRQLRASGAIRPGESVLLINTGSHLIPLAKPGQFVQAGRP